jgi:nicotinamidase/pyrazinamidase
MRRVLIAVDVQTGYAEGRDAVPEAEQVVSAIRAEIERGDYAAVIRTVDVPAVAQSWSADAREEAWAPPTEIPEHARPLLEQGELFYKTATAYRVGYSVWHARDRDGLTVPQRLAELQPDRVVVAGLSLDFCVRWSAIDALEAGYEVEVPLGLTRPMDLPLGVQTALDLRIAGAILT